LLKYFRRFCLCDWSCVDKSKCIYKYQYIKHSDIVVSDMILSVNSEKVF
jgi:hypothetical protein